MPLGPRRAQLQSELKELFGDVNNPATGEGLAKALSNFSKGVLPPTLGIVTGIVPATAAYDTAPAMDKITGIENAINEFAAANAAGMSVFLFTGTAPPPITGLKQLFELITRTKGTTDDMAKALSYAILANYTLGRSVFNPLNIPIPTWNIPILPGAITSSDSFDQNEIDRVIRSKGRIDSSSTSIDTLVDTDEFFDEMGQE